MRPSPGAQCDRKGAGRSPGKRGPIFWTLTRAISSLRIPAPPIIALAFLGAVALPPTRALAHCAPATGSNITVTCTGATVNQGAGIPGTTTGYGDGSQDGLKLNVNPGASVKGSFPGSEGPPFTGANGIAVRSGNAITLQSGAQVTGVSANGATGILATDGNTITLESSATVTGTSTGISLGANNTVNNAGAITTAGIGGVGDVFGINANGAALTVINSGTIGRLDIPDSIFDEAGINGNGGLSVTNKAGGVIQGTYGILSVGAGVVVNSGLINAIGGGGDGINFAGNTTSAVTVTNNGSGTITGDESGINASIATVFNYGTISAPVVGRSGIAILANTLTLTNYASGVITGDGGAISGSQTPNITVKNFGTISGTGLGAFGISGNIVNVTNTGNISVASGSGGGAISMFSGSVVNKAGGSITGDFDTIAADGNTSVFNAGTISAASGPAILFAFFGGNTLTLGPGSVINGAVQGFGADTFQLGGVGADTFNVSLIGSQYTGFTTFNKIGASTWTLTGVGAQDWSIRQGTLALGAITALGAGNTITMSGGKLLSLVTGAIASNIISDANHRNVISAASGQTFTLGPNAGASFIQFSPGSTTVFGSRANDGTVVVASDFDNVAPDAHVVVAGGTLRAGNGFTLGDALGTMLSTKVNAGATLDFNDAALSVVNNLKGAGLVLTGANPATTLFLFTGNNATNAATSTLFSGVIAGAGGVQLGAVGAGIGGLMILAGDNTYTGGTLIQSTTSGHETLQLGDGGTSGSILGDVVFQAPGVNGPNPGALVFDRSDVYTFAGKISGPGNVTQLGSGVLILTADNAYTGATTVAAGTL
ncbi:MAG: autotransporter-associated beta strand repeat-containing protein, partial [Roseiarcus sp.]